VIKVHPWGPSSTLGETPLEANKKIVVLVGKNEVVTFALMPHNQALGNA
jgi:hypothetical protein